VRCEICDFHQSLSLHGGLVPVPLTWHVQETGYVISAISLSLRGSLVPALLPAWHAKQ
jgi:uncharacterized membrane protein